MNRIQKSLTVSFSAAIGISLLGLGLSQSQPFHGDFIAAGNSIVLPVAVIDNPGPGPSGPSGIGGPGGRSNPGPGSRGGGGDHKLKPPCATKNCKVPQKPVPAPRIRAIQGDGQAGACSLARAVRQVKLYGINDPEVGRLTNATIALIGTRNGYKVRVEMNRHQRNCPIRRVVRM